MSEYLQAAWSVPKSDMEEIERSLPYLMLRIVRNVEESVNRWARPFGLRIEGVRVLYRLLSSRRTVGELAHLTGIELSTLSRLLGRMGDRDLIKRERRTDDNRSVMVSLTDQGRKLALEGRPVYFKDYEKIMLRGFTSQEARQFQNFLVRAMQSLESAGEVSNEVLEVSVKRVG